MSNRLKNELFNILSGKSKVGNGSIIQTIACYLKESERASSVFEKQQHLKKQEAQRLESFVSNHNLWIQNIDFSRYVSEGAEQKVFLKDG